MTDHPATARPGAAVPDAPVRAAAWDLRLARALPFALVCTLAAAVGHAASGGGNVALPALAAGFTAVLAFAALLGGRERSLAGIAGALAAGQLGLHGLFHSTAAHATAMTGMTHGGTGPMTAPQLAVRLLCNETHPGTLAGLPAGTTAEQLISDAGLDPTAYAAAPWWQDGLFGLTPGMFAGHLAAALVAGWWLRRGEAALWRLLRITAAAAKQLATPLRTVLALVAVLLRGLLGTPGGSVRRTGAGTGNLRLPVAAALRHSVVRRGPPKVAFAH
ncbi:hypothetical protein OG689_20150 [Kitasatospora sp. NBC_00240]|uniref:hypothetical protein n=1 Tax=Kitasatospora sp. NBC_00240 TaxID=2903567 RepID=UPI002254FC7E|nr:hypothetical protein [Kitasatospora sp. NBC_00240]MCX5211572.1 hypothetical protein [Kitasatospora sp. NBC_00240]